MSRQRYSRPPKYRRDTDGAYLCVWRECGKRLRGRLKYCSDACRHEVYIRCYPDAMRDYIEKRDKGVCALCGCDTEKLKRVLLCAERAARHRYLGQQANRSLLVEMGFNLLTPHLWEADHIVQWADGGSNEPENIRTLCLPCHKQASREFAAQRAAIQRERKRDEMILPLLEGMI